MIISDIILDFKALTRRFGASTEVKAFALEDFHAGGVFHRTQQHSFIDARRFQMNTFTMKSNWNEIAGKLKQQFANLTDDDLLFKQGKEEELLGRLQQKLGKTKEELRKIIAKI